MTLTTRQKRHLRDMLRGPVEDIMRSSIEEVLAEAKQPRSSLIERIIDANTNPQRYRASMRGKELPYAARVFARLGLVQAIGQGDRATALEAAHTLNVEDEYRKALSAGSAEGGGLLLQDDFADQIIELLRPVSVVRQLGVQEVEIPRGVKRTPRIDVGVTSGYVAEGAAIPASDLKTGAVVLTAKKLATLVVLSNELSTFAQDVNVDGIVLSDMLASIGQTEDVKLLFGLGTEAEPKGIVNQAVAANKFDANATVNLTNVQADLRTAEQLLLAANIPMQDPRWIMAPRTRLFLRDLRDTEDRGVFGKEMADTRTINGIRFFETNNIPTNLGAGTDESVVILVDAAQVMLGDVAQVSVDRSNAATVKIGGQDTNLFETDRSAIRVRQWNDIAMRHKTGIAVIEKVTWGV